MISVELTSRFLNTEISPAKRSSVENIAPKWGQRAKRGEEMARRIRLFRKFCAPSLAIGFVRRRGKAGCTVLKREKQGVARV